MFTLSHWAGIVAVISGLCAAQPAAEKQAQKRGKERKIKVTLVVILASEGKKEVHPLLKPIAREIQKKNANLTCFKFEKQTCQSLAVDEKFDFPLVDGKKAQVIVKRPADEKNRVELAVRAPDQVGFVYRSVCGKFLPIITNYQTKSKERLIFAVRVQPCHE